MPTATAQRSCNPGDDARDAYSVQEFCRRHSISVPLFYVLLKDGRAPRTMRVAGRVLVSREAARRWRRQRETAARA